MKLFLLLVLLAICSGQQGQIVPRSIYAQDGGSNPYVLQNGVYHPESTSPLAGQYDPRYSQPQAQFIQPQPQGIQPQRQYANQIPSLPAPGAEPMVGAVYFMTNDPRGNAIISNSITPSGALGFSKSFPTGGTGGYNIPFVKSPGEPDPLASQNSLIVNGELLFAVNAGSNSVSMFSINPSQPTELTHLATANTGGDFPVALAYSAPLRMLCALNAGTNNGVQCFQAEPGYGGQGLTPLPQTARAFGLPSSNPPRELGSMSDIIFTPDSSRLLVSVKGNPDPRIEGFIAAFPTGRNALGEAVVSIPNESVTPWGMSIVPGTGVNSDPVIAFSDPFGKGFGIATLNTRTGSITNSAMIKIPEQLETCWTAFSPRTGTLYTTDGATGKVTEAQLDVARHSAQILNQYPLANSSAPIDAGIASLKDKDVLYVLTSGEQSVHALSLIGPGQAYLAHRYFPAAANPGIVLNKGLQGLATYVIR